MQYFYRFFSVLIYCTFFLPFWPSPRIGNPHTSEGSAQTFQPPVLYLKVAFPLYTLLPSIPVQGSPYPLDFRINVIYQFSRMKLIPAPRFPPEHGLNNNIDTKAKCHHLEKFTCKGTLRQVFVRVYRLEIHSIMLLFSFQLYELLPL